MSLSNYPAGVTGNESHFDSDPEDFDTEGFCPTCGEDVAATAFHGRYGDCYTGVCSHEWEEDYEPEGDY